MKPKFKVGQFVRVKLTGAGGEVTHAQKIAGGWAYCLFGKDIYPKAWYKEDLLIETSLQIRRRQ